MRLYSYTGYWGQEQINVFYNWLQVVAIDIITVSSVNLSILLDFFFKSLIISERESFSPAPKN